MVDEELCDFIAKVEAAYSGRLLKSWERDTESFPEYVPQLEAVIKEERRYWKVPNT